MSLFSSLFNPRRKSPARGLGFMPSLKRKPLQFNEIPDSILLTGGFSQDSYIRKGLLYQNPVNESQLRGKGWIPTSRLTPVLVRVPSFGVCMLRYTKQTARGPWVAVTKVSVGNGDSAISKYPFYIMPMIHIDKETNEMDQIVYYLELAIVQIDLGPLTPPDSQVTWVEYGPTKTRIFTDEAGNIPFLKKLPRAKLAIRIMELQNRQVGQVLSTERSEVPADFKLAVQAEKAEKIGDQGANADEEEFLESQIMQPIGLSIEEKQDIFSKPLCTMSLMKDIYLRHGEKQLDEEYMHGSEKNGLHLLLSMIDK